MEGKFEVVTEGRWVDNDYITILRYTGEGPYNGLTFEDKCQPNPSLKERKSGRIEEVDYFLREMAIGATITLEDISDQENFDNPNELFEKAYNLYIETPKKYKKKVKEYKCHFKKERKRSNNLMGILRVGK